MSLTFTETTLRDHLASRLYAIFDPDEKHPQLLKVVQTSLKTYNKKVHTATKPMFTLELFLLVRALDRSIQELRSELNNALKDDALITTFNFQSAYLNFSVSQEVAHNEIRRIFKSPNQQPSTTSVFFPSVDLYAPHIDRLLFAATEVYAKILEELGNKVTRNLIVHDNGEKLALSITNRKAIPPYLVKKVLEQVTLESFDIKEFTEKGLQATLKTIQTEVLSININQITIVSSKKHTKKVSAYFNNLIVNKASDLLKDEASSMIFDARYMTTLIDMNDLPTDDAIAVNAYDKAAQLGTTIIAAPYPSDKINIKLAASYSRSRLVAISEPGAKSRVSTLATYLGIHAIPTSTFTDRFTATLATHLELNDVLNYIDSLQECVSKGSLKPIVKMVNATIARARNEDNSQAQRAYSSFLSHQLRLFDQDL